ncbi:MAG: AAA family ATPase [Clostridium sp.]|nr:AAA family ATPase [Clostridium sp.]
MARRVYELASILGLSNKQMIDILWENNIDVKNHMSIVEENFEDRITKEVISQSSFISHKNNSSLKFVDIVGLFYKNDYKINFNDDINIFIAENGFGKTTILNIIVATLKRDKNKLKKLPFKSIRLGINEEIIEISKEELDHIGFSKSQVRELLLRLREYIPEEKYRNIRNKYMHTNEIDIEEIFYLLKRYAYIEDIHDNFMWEYKSSLVKKKEGNKLDQKFKLIEKALKEEVLYLPTYRRIEVELDNFVQLSENEKRSFKCKFDSSTINFGMDDVETVINELTSKLKEDAINHYSIMNGEILDDLLSNKLGLSNKEKMRIDVDKIKIVVGRIGESRIKKLDKLMDFITNDSDVENKSFLEYYLFKLISIYESQKTIDEKIKKYRDVCNGYLVNKEIVYDEVIAEVRIVDKENGENINFSELSSGEKQILSLFSKLYLNTSKPMIFIIDEPELSLSIVWQQKLLKDIYDSGRIVLLIATTHSPFIFKNKFRTFAKELKMFERRGGLNE